MFLINHNTAPLVRSTAHVPSMQFASLRGRATAQRQFSHLVSSPSLAASVIPTRPAPAVLLNARGILVDSRRTRFTGQLEVWFPLQRFGFIRPDHVDATARAAHHHASRTDAASGGSTTEPQNRAGDYFVHAFAFPFRERQQLQRGMRVAYEPEFTGDGSRRASQAFVVADNRANTAGQNSRGASQSKGEAETFRSAVGPRHAAAEPSPPPKEFRSLLRRDGERHGRATSSAPIGGAASSNRTAVGSQGAQLDSTSRGAAYQQGRGGTSSTPSSTMSPERSRQREREGRPNAAINSSAWSSSAVGTNTSGWGLADGASEAAGVGRRESDARDRTHTSSSGAEGRRHDKQVNDRGWASPRHGAGNSSSSWRPDGNQSGPFIRRGGGNGDGGHRRGQDRPFSIAASPEKRREEFTDNRRPFRPNDHRRPDAAGARDGYGEVIAPRRMPMEGDRPWRSDREATPRPTHRYVSAGTSPRVASFSASPNHHRSRHLRESGDMVNDRQPPVDSNNTFHRESTSPPSVRRGPTGEGPYGRATFPSKAQGEGASRRGDEEEEDGRRAAPHRRAPLSTRPAADDAARRQRHPLDDAHRHDEPRRPRFGQREEVAVHGSAHGNNGRRDNHGHHRRNEGVANPSRRWSNGDDAPQHSRDNRVVARDRSSSPDLGVRRRPQRDTTPTNTNTTTMSSSSPSTSPKASSSRAVFTTTVGHDDGGWK